LYTAGILLAWLAGFLNGFSIGRTFERIWIEDGLRAAVLYVWDMLKKCSSNVGNSLRKLA